MNRIGCRLSHRCYRDLGKVMLWKFQALPHFSHKNHLVIIILAFCWAHVRRDFLDAARKYPELEEWAFFGIEKNWTPVSYK